jgi:hypothetical protein
VNRLVGHSPVTCSLCQAIFLEEDWHNIIADGIKVYFDWVKHHLQIVPSMLIWTANEAKKQQVLTLIVSANTGPGLITVPEIRCDSQVTFLIAISAFGDSIQSLFLSKHNTSEKNRLAEEQSCEEHD